METDIRIERTKTSLREAFVELLNEVPAYSISVTNLTKKAKISRVTFYIHYNDMSDFVDKTCDQVLGEIKWPAGKGLDVFRYDKAKVIFRKQMELVRENSDLFRALLGKNGPDYFWSKFMDMVSAEYIPPISTYHKDKFENEDDIDSLVRYAAAGEIILVTDWINTEPVASIDSIVEKVITFTYRGLFASLGMMEEDS